MCEECRNWYVKTVGGLIEVGPFTEQEAIDYAAFAKSQSFTEYIVFQK